MSPDKRFKEINKTAAVSRFEIASRANHNLVQLTST